MPAKTNAQSKKQKKRNMQDDRIDRPARFDMLDVFLYYFVQFHTALHVLFSKTVCVFVTYQPMPACKCDRACLARIMARRCFSYKEW